MATEGTIVSMHPKSKMIVEDSRHQYGFTDLEKLPADVIRVCDQQGTWCAFYRTTNPLTLTGFVHGEPPAKIYVAVGTRNEIDEHIVETQKIQFNRVPYAQFRFGGKCVSITRSEYTALLARQCECGMTSECIACRAVEYHRESCGSADPAA